MDNKLLESLNNLSLALEEIAKALKDKKEPKSATAKAIQGGDFIKEIKEISDGVKNLQKDTKKILANQKTIIDLGKKGSGDKKDVTEELGKDKEKQNAFKEGIGTIMLIAVAVLAIGAAFKIIGNVNFLSVISLSIAISLLATSFIKIHKSFKEVGFDPKQDSINFIIVISSIALSVTIASVILSAMIPLSFGKVLTAIFIAGGFALLAPSISKFIKAFKNTSFSTFAKTAIYLPTILVAISLAITLSSMILKSVIPVSFGQIITSILIAGLFAVVSFGFSKLIHAFKGMSTRELTNASIFLPLILPAISLSVAISSWFLYLVIPVSFGQLITSILIAGIFTVISFGFSKLIHAFRGMSIKELTNASIFLPLILPAMALSIAISSWFLGLVEPINMGQFLTALGISAIFIVFSFSIMIIMKSLKGMTEREAIVNSIIIPILFVAMSAAILGSAWLFSQMPVITAEQFLTAIGITIVFTILSIAIIPISMVVKIVGKKNLIIAGLFILALSFAIALSSRILSIGSYDNYPSYDWAVGVSLSMIGFLPVILVLGSIVAASLGFGLIAISAGIAATPLIAATIVAVSKVLSTGSYSTYPSLEWAKSVALLYQTFVPLSLISSFYKKSWEEGRAIMTDVAETIKEVSFILKSGSYEGGPTEEWSSGISLAIGAFSPVYMMLVRNKIFEALGKGGGVGPKEFEEAILTVSRGIIIAAIYFANNKVAFKNGPSEEWAYGVGGAISAFTPAFDIIANSGGWFREKITVEDFKNAILIISEGIITAAYYFSLNKAPFREGNYPSEDWAYGVGAALGAFTPVFEQLSGKSWYQSSSDVIRGMITGILSTSMAIVESAKIFNSVSSDRWDSYPPENWATNIGDAISTYIDIVNELKDKDIDVYYLDIVPYYAEKMAKTAYILGLSKEYFNTKIDPNYIKNIEGNFLDYIKLTKTLMDSGISGISPDNSFGGKIKRFFGINDEPEDPIQRVAKGMTVMATGFDSLAKSLNNFSSAINNLDPIKMSSFSRLTGNIALLSAMDHRMFNNMLNVLESRGGVFAELLKQNYPGVGTKLSEEDLESVKKSSKKDDKKDIKKANTENDKLDIIIGLIDELNKNTKQLVYKISFEEVDVNVVSAEK